MAYQDLLEQATQLSFDERLALVEHLAQQLQAELDEGAKQTPLSSWLRGLLKSDRTPMTKSEVRDILTLERIQKHLHE